MRARLILNPVAGQRKAARKLFRVHECLHERGVLADIIVTRYKGEALAAARHAADLNYERVIVGAGDGTINEVVNGLAGTECALSVVPLGTGNVFAADVGLPTSVERACEVLTEGEVRRVDLGKAGNRFFLLMAGVGFDAAVVHEVKPQLKSVLGGYAYVLSTLNNFFKYESSALRLTLENDETVTREAWFAMFGNVASYAWNVKVTPLAVIDDGFLDLCLFPASTKFDQVRQAIRTLMGQHIEYREVEYRRLKRAVVESDPPVPVQLDGDSAGMTPVEITVIPKALSVVFPRSRVEKQP